MTKRNLADVIDAMLALVPDGDETRGLRMSLTACKSSVVYTAPEAMSVRWQQCAQLLASHIGVPSQPWHLAVFGVWNPDASLEGDVSGVKDATRRASSLGRAVGAALGEALDAVVGDVIASKRPKGGAR